MEYLITQLPLFVSLGATIVTVHLIVRLRRLEPLPVTFPSPKSEALIALIPLLVLVAVMALALWGAATTRSEPSAGMAAAPYTFAHALRQLALNLIIFLPFALVMLVRKHGLKTIGLTGNNLPESTLVGIVSGVAAGAVYGMLSTTFWFSAETVHRLVAQLGVGFSEEAIFRGFLQTRFSAWLGMYKGELLTAVLFALVHIPQRLFAATAGVDLLIDLFVLLVWGLVFGWAMRRLGNIAGLSILHAIINLFAP
jgi:membrane protease YdiL (CAAX protease family)